MDSVSAKRLRGAQLARLRLMHTQLDVIARELDPNRTRLNQRANQLDAACRLIGDVLRMEKARAL